MEKSFAFMIDSNTALLLIDIQKGLDDWEFYGGQRNNPNAEENMLKLLIDWRKEKRPVFHVRHSSTNLNSPLHPDKAGFQIKDLVAPLKGEPLFTKNVNSAFIGTDLEKSLKKKGIKKLVAIGLTTNHCISSSVRMAANLGFEVFLISDATACFDGVGIDGTPFAADLIHHVTLANLKDEFAQILNTEVLLEEIK